MDTLLSAAGFVALSSSLLPALDLVNFQSLENDVLFDAV